MLKIKIELYEPKIIYHASNGVKNTDKEAHFELEKELGRQRMAYYNKKFSLTGELISFFTFGKYPKKPYKF